jgi:NLR family CARD domain-containing protein 3
VATHLAVCRRFRKVLPEATAVTLKVREGFEDQVKASTLLGFVHKVTLSTRANFDTGCIGPQMVAAVDSGWGLVSLKLETKFRAIGHTASCLWERGFAPTTLHTLQMALSGNLGFPRPMHRASRRFPEDDMSSLVPFIGSLTGLNTLVLSQIILSNKGVGHLAKALRFLTSLHTLDVSGNYIGWRGTQSLAEHAVLTSLHTLKISDNPIGKDPLGARYLATVLRSLTGLHTLGVGHTDIGLEAAISLAHCTVLGSLTGLHTLDLREWNFHLGLAELLGSLTNLQTLDMGGMSGFGPEGGKQLAGVLGSLTGLHTLILKANDIGDEGMEYLAAVTALGSLTGLHRLDVRFNQIGDKGATSLARVLGSLRSLHTLEVSYNPIGGDGASVLAQPTVLGALTGLHSLKVGTTNLKERGARYVGNVLGSLTGLHRLDVDCNSIGDRGAKYLARGLLLLTGLRALSVNHNAIGDKGARYLAEVLLLLTGLHALSFNHNAITNVGADYLVQSLLHLKTASDLHHTDGGECKYLEFS